MWMDMIRIKARISKKNVLYKLVYHKHVFRPKFEISLEYLKFTKFTQ